MVKTKSCIPDRRRSSDGDKLRRRQHHHSNNAAAAAAPSPRVPDETAVPPPLCLDEESVLSFPDVEYAPAQCGYERTLDVYVKKKHYPHNDNYLSAAAGRHSSQRYNNKQQHIKNAKRPVIVYLHGGAWILGDKDEFNSRAISYHFCKQGFVGVSVSYRLTSVSNRSLTSIFLFLSVLLGLLGLVSTFAEKAFFMSLWLVLTAVLIIVLVRRPQETLRHPCHVLDCAHAIRWVHDHIDEYGGDPSRVLLVGHSAGGHLCALLCSNPRFLGAVGLRPNYLAGGVCISGVYNDRALHMGTLATNLLYETFGPDENIHKDAFAIHHLRPDVCPPLFVLSAERDFSLKRQAREFVSTARSRCVYVEARRYPATNHYSIILGWDKHNWRVLRDIMHFCKRALRERRRAAAGATTR